MSIGTLVVVLDLWLDLARLGGVRSADRLQAALFILVHVVKDCKSILIVTCWGWPDLPASFSHVCPRVFSRLYVSRVVIDKGVFS